MSKGSVLELQDVHKLYGDGELEPVLKGVSLKVVPGEMLGILGVSGSGKTTLLNIMGLLEPASSGRVLIMDEDCTAVSTAEGSVIRNKYLGFVFQFFCLLPEFSLWENILIPSYFHPSRQDRRARAEELVRRLEIGHVVGRRPGQVSGGEKQRAALARALINEPVLLLADEPTGNLDQENSQRIFGLIRELVEEEGLAAVVVTHDVALAQGYCHRLLYLQDGILQKASG
ncbi:MAG: ABC transporter ATP-binding protein [Limnochordia bacterium]|jgi:lipoprotein-releasing system ATP-binding protein